MQLLFETNEEGGVKGLGWINGRVKRFDFQSVSLDRKLVVPHRGWNELNVSKTNPLFVNTEIKDRFYFVYSFHANDVPAENIIGSSHYGYDFMCAVQRENIYRVFSLIRKRVTGLECRIFEIV